MTWRYRPRPHHAASAGPGPRLGAARVPRLDGRLAVGSRTEREVTRILDVAKKGKTYQPAFPPLNHPVSVGGAAVGTPEPGHLWGLTPGGGVSPPPISYPVFHVMGLPRWAWASARAPCASRRPSWWPGGRPVADRAEGALVRP